MIYLLCFHITFQVYSLDRFKGVKEAAIFLDAIKNCSHVRRFLQWEAWDQDGNSINKSLKYELLLLQEKR